MTRLTKTELKEMIDETARNHEEVRAHIEFAYLHYPEFLQYCKDVVTGKRKPAGEGSHDLSGTEHPPSFLEEA